MKHDAHAGALEKLWTHLEKGDGQPVPFDWVVEHAPDGKLDRVWRSCQNPFYLVDVAAWTSHNRDRETVFRIVEDIIMARAASAFRTMGQPAIGAWQGYVLQAVARGQWSHAAGMLAGDGKYGETYRAAAADMKGALADIHGKYAPSSLSEAVSTLSTVISPRWFANRFRRLCAERGLAVPTLERVAATWPVVR